MAATARLRHGADLIYFEDGTNYQLGDDFTPPGSSLAASFSDGTSANVYGGGIKTAEKAYNRDVTFTVLCVATTANNAAPQSLASRLVTMLGAAGDETNPVWFEWTLTPGLPEPVWGQFGAWRRAEVRHAGWVFSDRLGQYSRSEVVEVSITLTVAPYALGTRQEIARGGGEVDYFGTSSFTPSGVRFSVATTNRATNPIFANRTAWNTAWTASANITAYENIDTNFVYPGAERSAYLVASSSAGTYLTPITVSSTASITQQFSAYVKRPDSAAVTSADCEIYAGAALTTAFTLLGNGVYRATASAAPTTSAGVDVGIQVQANRSIYLMAFQAEEAATWSPLACGDIPPSGWDGAAHASSSSRLVSNGAGFTIIGKSGYGGASAALAWEPDYSSTATGTKYFFSSGGLEAYYNASDDKFYLTDGTNTISSAAQTFAAGDTIRIICTGGPTGLDLYVNGTNTTGAAYVNATAAGANLGGAAGRSPSTGIIRAFEWYDYKLTSAQALALDAALAAAASSDDLDCPILASSDVSAFQAFQFPNATYPWANYFFVQAIAGDTPPIVDLEQFNSGILTNLETKLSWANNVGTSYAPTGLMYDCSTAAISASTAADTVLATWPVYRINEIMGKTVWVAVRMTDAGSNLQLDFGVSMGGTSVRVGYASYVADATARMFYLGPLYIPSRAAFPERSVRNSNLVATATLYGQRTTGTANVEVDYVDIMLPQMMRVMRTSSSTATTPLEYIWDGSGVLYDSYTPQEQLRITGDKTITLAPMARNIIHFQPGTNATANATEQTISGYVYITPRWAL